MLLVIASQYYLKIKYCSLYVVMLTVSIADTDGDDFVIDALSLSILV